MNTDKRRNRAEHAIRVNLCHPWFKNVFVIYRVIFTNSLVSLMGCLAGPLHTPAAAADEEIVRVGDNWRYFKGTSAAPRAWKSLTFDDKSWAQGPGGIGYSTDIQYGTNLPDMHNGYWSVFMRRKFSIADPKTGSALKLAARYDDGFVAYVNGVEIARSPNIAART